MSLPAASAETRTSAFATVVCGVDETRAAAEAARQAAVLAAPAGSLELVAVAHAVGFGPTRMADLSPERAERRLQDVVRELERDGVAVTTSVLHADNAAPALVDACLATSADLVAVGARPGGRAGGIMLGATSSALLHRAPVSVLVARPVPPRTAFPARVLVASDGSACARAAVRAAEAIARAHGADVTLVHAGETSGEQGHRLATDAAMLAEAMGKEPVVLVEEGRAHAVIARLAKTVGASLVIVGSRGLRGIAALGSVSERVAHEAPCSVLVVREP